MKKHPDYFLLGSIIALLIWGIFTLATISFPFSLQKYGTSWYYFLHQLLVGFLPGILIAFIFYKLKLDLLKKISLILFGLNIFLLILVFIPGIGVEINGAKRWLQLGPVLIQPSEFLKITFLLYLATWLSSKLEHKEKNKQISWQAPFVFIIALAVLAGILLCQPDLSTLMIICIIGVIVYFTSSTPWWHTLLIVLGGAGLGGILIKLSPYRLERVITLLNPQNDPLGKGYQLKQSLITIGSGKWLGIQNGFGLGLSRQKFGFLPHPMSDSIFAIIGEELGFFGCLILLSLFIFFAFRGIKSSLKNGSEFSKLLGIGIVSWLTLQAFFNIAGITGILPIAGIPLPFFSYGSSHLITELAGIGILLNISKK